MMLAPTQPSIIGVSTLPAAVALVPNTACAKSGMNDVLPNIAQPASSPWLTATAKSRSLKSGSGSTGSATRRSTHSRTMNRTAASPISPTPSGF